MTGPGKDGRDRRPVVAVAIAAALGAASIGAIGWLGAADHADSPLVESDASVDIADVYSFRSPENPANVVLAMTLHGFIPPAESGTSIFDPDVLYQFEVDTDGDAVEDRVIQAFVTREAGTETMHFRGPATPSVTGAQARVVGSQDAASVEVTTTATPITATAGDMRVFAGLRDDPFFFDFARFTEIRNGEAAAFRDPGVDAFAGFNVYAIVVELPAAALGGGEVGIWGTTSRR